LAEENQENRQGKIKNPEMNRQMEIPSSELINNGILFKKSCNLFKNISRDLIELAIALF
jgi:hypothetical protein